MSLRRLAGRLVGAALLAFVPIAFAGQAAAQELRIGLRNEPTALDPQYQNSQANNQIALHIFEPRYRKMLADALSSHRMFSVAMQKPGSKRESPCPVAGLGLIRASVQNKDGTSHLILQGLTRIRLEETVRRRPYRIERFHMLTPDESNSVTVDALADKLEGVNKAQFLKTVGEQLYRRPLTDTELSTQVVSLQDILANKQARGAFGQRDDTAKAMLPITVSHGSSAWPWKITARSRLGPSISRLSTITAPSLG